MYNANTLEMYSQRLEMCKRSAVFAACHLTFPFTTFISSNKAHQSLSSGSFARNATQTAYDDRAREHDSESSLPCQYDPSSCKSQSHRSIPSGSCITLRPHAEMKPTRQPTSDNNSAPPPSTKRPIGDPQFIPPVPSSSILISSLPASIPFNGSGALMHDHTPRRRMWHLMWHFACMCRRNSRRARHATRTREVGLVDAMERGRGGKVDGTTCLVLMDGMSGGDDEDGEVVEEGVMLEEIWEGRRSCCTCT